MIGFGLSPASLPIQQPARGLSQNCPAQRNSSRPPIQMNAGEAETKAKKGLPGLLQGLFRRLSSRNESEAATPTRDARAAPVPNLALADVVAAPTAQAESPSSSLLPPQPVAIPQEAPVLGPPRPPRDPRRVLVVGASGRLGREVIQTLVESPTRYTVVGVVRSLADAPKGCTHTLSLDAATQGPLLVDEAIRLGCGSVVWCASAGPGGDLKPRDVDFGAVSSLAAALGDARLPSMDGQSAQKWLADGDDVLPLVDLSTAEGRAAFCPVNDVIMGGRSSSAVRDGVPGRDNGAPAVWSGDIVASGGGFASIRAPLMRNVFTQGVDLSSYDGIAVTCRGDGKRYKINLKNDGKPEFVFQARFETADNGQWQTVRVPFADFLPVKRGKLAYADNSVSGAVYAAELDATNIFSIGLVCSKIDIGGSVCPRFAEGPFRLDLARLDAYRAVAPRFVLVSSAAVTRPFWDNKRKRLYSSAANIPIVQLNEKIGNVLGAKLAGEDALRTSQIPYTVVRPTALVSELADRMAVRYFQGDTATGRIAPADVARVIVAALQSEDAAWKTFEVSGDPNSCWSAEDSADAMRALPLDSEQILYPFPTSTL
jgi:Complex I intermediate-associated protein 30 (CIA30)/NAD(P)H-binding